jgi:hypothetical protein
VNGFHVEGVTEDKGDLLLGAEVGDPIPGEEALDADGDVGSEGSEGIEEALFVGGEGGLTNDGAGLIEDADGEEPGMQVDATVASVRTGVELHHELRSAGVGA